MGFCGSKKFDATGVRKNGGCVNLFRNGDVNAI